MVVGGRGVSLRVHKRGSEIEEQVAEQRSDALCQENLQAERFFRYSNECVFPRVSHGGFGAHRRPADLRAEIPQVHGDSGAHC